MNEKQPQRRWASLRHTAGTKKQRQQRVEADYVQVLMNPDHFAKYREWLASRNLMAGRLPFDAFETEFPTYIITPTDDEIRREASR